MQKKFKQEEYIWIESMTRDYHDPGILATQDQY